MARSYVIEPPEGTRPDAGAPDAHAGDEPVAEPPTTHRPRIGAVIMDKLDAILEAVHADPGAEGEGAPEGAPEVTFEPEPDHLPVTAGDEEPEETPEGGAAEGDDETTGNKADAFSGRSRPEFKFPGRRYKRNDL